MAQAVFQGQLQLVNIRGSLGQLSRVNLRTLFLGLPKFYFGTAAGLYRGGLDLRLIDCVITHMTITGE